MKSLRALFLAATVVVFALLLVKRSFSLAEIIHPPVNANDSRTPLYFSLIQASSGQSITVNSMVGLEVALDFINADPTLLPGYSLHYVFIDALVRVNTACNSSL